MPAKAWLHERSVAAYRIVSALIAKMFCIYRPVN